MANKNLEHLRHSLAHLLGAAVLELYPNSKLAIGPAIDDGFYYDIDVVGTVSDDDLPKIEEKMRELLKTWDGFEKIDISVQDAKTIFKNNNYKLELIEELENKGEAITLYYSGPKEKSPSVSSLLANGYLLMAGFLDLCRGGHVDNIKDIDLKAFKLSRLAGAYWRGDEKNPQLTRIYGLAFATKDDLKAHLTMLEEAKKRDHRKLGAELDLFMFHETAPGMPYWLPKGLILYNELVNYWRVEHAQLGYQEIASPLVNKAELWKMSGHWEHYKDDMFIANMGENEIYGIKPMNCPNAMLVFKSKSHSYKELPIRLSDTDRLHRYERSGTLNGLLRCRSFQQDDSHNFISEDMIGSEYEHIFEICKKFYGIFRLEYSFRLGTRPTAFLGEQSTWDKAEQALKEILEKSGKQYTIAEGDGAFYGPKIDIIMKDAIGREWQMGTIQLDFQLPQRFELEYTATDGSRKTPVVVHRVVYGSLERFIGVLIEHYAGAFPLWLSPVQVAVVTISETQQAWAEAVMHKLRHAGIRAELHNENETLGKKIRNAEKQKTPYIFVVGDKEVKSQSVAVRKHVKSGYPPEDGQVGTMQIDTAVAQLKEEIELKK